MAKNRTESPSTSPATITDDYALAILYRLFGLRVEPFRGGLPRLLQNIWEHRRSGEENLQQYSRWLSRLH